MAATSERVTEPEHGRRIAAPCLDESQRAWLANLYESNFTAVFRACQRVLRNPEDAADAAHEVFLRAVDSLPGRSAGDSARPWLIAVARNHCLDLLRRRKRLGRALVTLGASSDHGVDAEDAVANRQVVDAVLQQLGLREREALWQSAVEDRPLADVASYLGVTYMAAAQVLHRARRHALLVAAKLAAIFGLYQLGRSTRRTSHALTRMLSLEPQGPAGGIASIGPLAAAAIVPLILAVLVSSSSPQRSAPVAGSLQVGQALPNAAVSAKVPSHSVGTAAPSNGAVPGGALVLPSVHLPSGGTSPLNSGVTTVMRAITQLTGHPVPSASATVPALPLPGVTPKP